MLEERGIEPLLLSGKDLKFELQDALSGIRSLADQLTDPIVSIYLPVTVYDL